MRYFGGPQTHLTQNNIITYLRKLFLFYATIAIFRVLSIGFVTFDRKTPTSNEKTPNPSIFNNWFRLSTEPPLQQIPQSSFIMFYSRKAQLILFTSTLSGNHRCWFFLCPLRSLRRTSPFFHRPYIFNLLFLSWLMYWKSFSCPWIVEEHCYDEQEEKDKWVD